MTPGTGGDSLKTLSTAFEIVDAIQELDGARVTELASHLDLPPSTVHGYLSTLRHNSYLVKEGDSYYVGLEFLNKGGYARSRKQGYALVETKVEQLAERTGERVQFVVEENGRGYYIYTAIGENAVEADARAGKRIYLHDSSAGKSILAHLPEARVDGIIDRWGLPEFTAETITDRADLYDELATVRERGFALNHEESHTGLRAVGAPVRHPAGHVLGAFSLSGPSNRLKGEYFERELPDTILGLTNEVELNMSYL